MNENTITAELPKLSRLATLARECIKTGSPITHLKDCLSEVLLSDELRRVTTNAVREFLNNPAANPALMQQDNIVLANEPNGALIAIGTTEFREDYPIYTSSYDALIGAAGPSGFRFALYATSRSYSNQIFDPTVEIEETEVGVCEYGDSKLFAEGQPCEYQDTGSLVLKVVAQRSTGCMMWEFDRATRRARRAYAADAAQTTVRYLLRFLAEFGDSGSLEAMKTLLCHPCHYVRWDTVKAIGRLDGDELAPILRRMKDDPHPHIQRASVRMLEQLGV